MRLIDYVRLGAADIRVRKKKSFLAVATVGLIFGILTMSVLLIQGAENAVLSEMTAPTRGKVLLEVTPRQQCMQDGCELVDSREIIGRVTNEYGGEILDDGSVQIGAKRLPVIATETLLSTRIDMGAIPEDVTPVLATLNTLAMWQQSALPQSSDTVEHKMQTMSRLRAGLLGNEIVIGEQKVLVAGVLPGAFGISTLSLAGVGQKMSPLNIILEHITIGESGSFVLDNTKREASGQDDQKSVLVLLPDIPTAISYKHALDAEACSLSNFMQHNCEAILEFGVDQAIGSPMDAYEAFVVIWRVYGYIVVGLVIVAGIVMLSTYTRLINDDAKKIALYYAFGANRWQVTGVYCVYLLVLSLLATLLAIVVGVISAVLVNLLNMQALSRVFALAFGGEIRPVFFFGINLWLIALFSAVLAFAAIAMVLNFRRYGRRRAHGR